MSDEGDIAKVGLELILVIVNLIRDAVTQKDPSKLRKVGDVLRRGQPLEARVALIEERQAQLAARRGAPR